MSQSRVAEAIKTTRQELPGYFEALLNERVSQPVPVYPGLNQSQLKQILLAANWEEYPHPAVPNECIALKADIPGRLGTVDLHSLPRDTIVTLYDYKGNGKVSAIVRGVQGQSVSFTVIVLGLESENEIVYTFHPGDPSQPTQVAKPEMHGQKVTISEALEMGLEIAEIV